MSGRSRYSYTGTRRGGSTGRRTRQGRRGASASQRAQLRVASNAASTGGNRRQNVRTAGFLGIEHKFYDTFVTDSTIITSGTATGGTQDPSGGLSIAAPAQGDTSFSRDGKKIMVESVQITGVVRVSHRDGLSTGVEKPTFFIALVQDTQTNGAPLLSQSVYTNPGNSTRLASSIIKNLLSGKRFRTLKIWTLIPEAPGLAPSTDTDDMSSNGTNIPFEFYKKLQMVVEFNGGTTANIANVVDNSLHMIAFTNDASWTSKLDYNARIRFVG